MKPLFNDVPRQCSKEQMREYKFVVSYLNLKQECGREMYIGNAIPGPALSVSGR